MRHSVRVQFPTPLGVCCGNWTFTDRRTFHCVYQMFDENHVSISASGAVLLSRQGRTATKVFCFVLFGLGTRGTNLLAFALTCRWYVLRRSNSVFAQSLFLTFCYFWSSYVTNYVSNWNGPDPFQVQFKSRKILILLVKWVRSLNFSSLIMFWMNRTVPILFTFSYNLI